MVPDTDTIAAIATPSGRGSVGIVRVSGARVPDIARGTLGCLPAPRRANYLPFLDADGSVVDTGFALFFPAPNSLTGEDVLELQGHGGPVVLDLLLKRVTAQGARLARPGEFSERAFLNDKMDLTQAEAVADLIACDTEQGARAALRALQGEFSQRVRQLVEALTERRVYVEAALDFPEEEIDFLSDPHLQLKLGALIKQLDALLDTARQGCLLREGMTVVIAGPPNAGKSSLLNRLAGYDAAIVSALPGTTRDLLREHIQIDGMPLHVIDTAGLRTSADRLEQEGMRRALAAIEQADRVLLVIDDCVDLVPSVQDTLSKLPAGCPRTVVRNKIDLTGRASGMVESELGPELALSALTGAGMDMLRAHLKDCMGYRSSPEGSFMARRRHLDALQRARGALERGSVQLVQAGAGELLAEELRQAQRALGEITGEVTTEDLLDRIFSTFCIGK
jgi:tRNA modification GTPase TrmE